jgi:hypothetical protein
MNSGVILMAKPVNGGPEMYLIYRDKKHAANTAKKEDATVFVNESVANFIAKQLPIIYTAIPA